MGCNTSQELKTKDPNAVGANGEGELAALAASATTTNGEVGVNVGNEQNGNLLEQQKGVSNGGGDGTQSRMTTSAVSAASATSAISASAANATATATSNNLTNHSKSNSIISNGDANKRTTRDHDDGGILEKALATVKQQQTADKADLSEFNDMSELGVLGEDEAKAATKIQAVFRGHQVRTTMKKCETKSNPTVGSVAAAAASAQRNIDNKNVAASAVAAAVEAEPTKAELEAEFDPNDKELCDAAAKIQAAFRGHLTRKVVTKDAPDDVDIQEITKKVAEELDIDLSDPELNKAATKIQASFRGHKIRKDIVPTE